MQKAGFVIGDGWFYEVFKCLGGWLVVVVVYERLGEGVVHGLDFVGFGDEFLGVAGF